MSAPVNVLAVMAEAMPIRCNCGIEKCGINELRAELAEASAAVRELVASGEFLLERSRIAALRADENPIARFRAALSRCGGTP
jgi:hypothetical protein